MKKFLLTAAVAFGALTVAAVGAQAKFTFALVPKNMNNPFFDQARDGCKKAEAESNGAFECMYIGPGEHGGGDEQVQIVQDLVAKKVDGIAVAVANAAAMTVALQAAKDAGIPVLTWDSDMLPENKDLRLAYIGTHNYEIGTNLATLAMKIKPKGGTVCIQSGGAAAASRSSFRSMSQAKNCRAEALTSFALSPRASRVSLSISVGKVASTTPASAVDRPVASDSSPGRTGDNARGPRAAAASQNVSSHARSPLGGITRCLVTTALGYSRQTPSALHSSTTPARSRLRR